MLVELMNEHRDHLTSFSSPRSCRHGLELVPNQLVRQHLQAFMPIILIQTNPAKNTSCYASKTNHIFIFTAATCLLREMGLL